MSSRLAPDPARRFYGLGRHLDAGQVCSVMETYAPHARQAIELRERGRCGPVVVSCFENVPFLYEQDPLDAATKAFVRERADHFIAVTPEAADALAVEGADRDKVNIIPFGVDVEALQPGARDLHVRREWALADDQVAVLYAGRLIAEKGIVELLRAFAVARDFCPELVLVVVGRGGDGPRIARVVTQLGLETSVRLRGWVSADELPPMYRSADVVVLPSLTAPYWQEQLGFVLLEAMACARPIISTRSGSIPWVVGEAALLATPYDVPELTEALITLGRDEGLRARLGTAGRERVESTFSTMCVAGQLDELLRRVA